MSKKTDSFGRNLKLNWDQYERKDVSSFRLSLSQWMMKDGESCYLLLFRSSASLLKQISTGMDRLIRRLAHWVLGPAFQFFQQPVEGEERYKLVLETSIPSPLLSLQSSTALLLSDLSWSVLSSLHHYDETFSNTIQKNELRGETSNNDLITKSPVS